jgi:hypothetical protein
MNKSPKQRFDEVDQYYSPIKTLAAIGSTLFWFIAALSLCMLYVASIKKSSFLISLQTVFIMLVLIDFGLSQISRLYLFPRAENMRRRHLLSDAFGAPLSHDRTSLYYNNQCPPSVQRLGANTMENALFSKEITGVMLARRRIEIGGYVVVWLLAFCLRLNNLTVIMWITQFVFSGHIVAQWLNLEVLHAKNERAYETLHHHFLYEINQDSERGIASVLDAFVLYEAAKSSAGVMLSTKVFQKLNPSLTEKWNRICEELKIDFQQDSQPDQR